ncbi:MAG: serine hydrolase domain-containing protein, partial [Bacteroidota bacterium]
FFPGFPYSGITVHMLLTHRSGLPNYIYFIDEMVKDKYTFISNQAVIRLMTKFRPDRYYPPDMTFDYSNTGYMLLAAIIEKVSGLDYGDYMDKSVFKPLGMDHTVVYNRNRNTEIQYRTSGYLYRIKEAENNFLNGITGDKGIYTSIEDMHKWDRALYTDSLLKRETIMLAFQPMGKSRDAFENYGYGWRMYNSGDTMKVLYHGGWWQGYHNMYVRLEKDSTAIIILKNKKTRHAVNHEELFGILYRRF